MAHIFFERLERRRSTQTLWPGGLPGELPGGLPGNSYSISRNVMMPISAGATYYAPASYPHYSGWPDGWHQTLNLTSSFQWHTGSRQYSPISDMSWYNGQATRFSMSSLISNLFTTQQQPWNLGIRNMGDTWLYQPYQLVNYPEIIAPGGRWPEIAVYYGFPIGIGYPVTSGSIEGLKLGLGDFFPNIGIGNIGLYGFPNF